MYVLVRHGHALSKKEWPGADADRPLSPRGFQQAEGFAENFHALLSPRLVVSPYLRCVQTLTPLAARLRLTITTSDLLVPGADVSRLNGLLASPEADGAVLCTHGETLDALFARWQDRGSVTIADGTSSDLQTEKGAAWVVTTEGNRHILRYQRPLHVGPLLRDTTS